MLRAAERGGDDVPALEAIQSQEEVVAMVASLYQRDPGSFARHFSDDVEFYHDQARMTVGLEKLTEALKKNICGKMRRELVAGSVQVYPMKGFGEARPARTAFTSRGVVGQPAWRSSFTCGGTVEGAWRITRVISFDLRAAN